MWTKSRREFLRTMGMGFGSAAACSLLEAATPNPLAPKSPHESPRAKSVICLFMHGGVSHVDTWDPKPELARLSGNTLPGSFVKGLKTSRIDFTKALARGAAWDFRRHGQSGIEISTLFPEIAKHADELFLVRSCHGDAFDHAPAMYSLSTGSQFPGKPCLGSWAVYGLGTENQNLPAFVVMTDGAMKSGPQGYGAGYLPAVYQGTVFRGGSILFSIWPRRRAFLQTHSGPRSTSLTQWTAATSPAVLEIPTWRRAWRPMNLRSACKRQRLRPWTWAKSLRRQESCMALTSP